MGSSWFTLSDSALEFGGKSYRRNILARIELSKRLQRLNYGEPLPPEDMVTWKGGLRSFGPVTVKSTMLQPGRAPRALPDALQIAFGSPRPERVSPVVLQIGELKQNRTSRAAPIYDIWNCSVELSREAAADFKRLKRAVTPAPPTTPGTLVYWAEFLASRREGQRYGPDRQKLCRFDVTRVLALRYRALPEVKQ